MRPGVWLFLTVILILNGTSTAWADKVDPAQEPSAQLRFVHGLADAPAIDIYLDGVKIVAELPAGHATSYGLAATGNHEVIFREAGAKEGEEAPQLEEEITLNTGLSYTLAIAATQDGGPGAYLFEDDTSQRDDGQGTFRLVNLAPGQERVSAVANETAVMGLVAHGEASDRVAIGTGSPVLTVIDEGGNPLLTTEPLAVEGGQFYTLFLVERPGDETPRPIVVSYPLTDGEIPEVPVWEEVDEAGVTAAEEESPSTESEAGATTEGPEVKTLPKTGKAQEMDVKVGLLIVYGFLLMLLTLGFYWWRRGSEPVA